MITTQREPAREVPAQGGHGEPDELVQEVGDVVGRQQQLLQLDDGGGRVLRSGDERASSWSGAPVVESRRRLATELTGTKNLRRAPASTPTPTRSKPGVVA
ncbi:MAG: hypothetical protein AVDCRST_MAG66-1454 [uncultured Pseudonocardia sp.]|uniref:Uncharacterized protein n=1 Tax=uncultured Pseudonocardia sp. TaxID=211455 RepID=A0A6J4NY42_9PSEU|nr:MAG: hypothetical protein AVDCRST_MAG66-1454 [uncultured Pseudonocardia sp.]